MVHKVPQIASESISGLKHKKAHSTHCNMCPPLYFLDPPLRPDHDVLCVYEEPHPGDVNNNCMQPSMNNHSLLT